MAESYRYLIIGAGPCGLGAAVRLKELGETDYHVVEANPWVGGLASSFVDAQGFTWDIGGHVQFSHYEYFDRAMDRALGVDGWLHHQRDASIWIENRFVPYPLQNNIHHLSRETALKCIMGLLDLPQSQTGTVPANFSEWSKHMFGSGLTSVFLEPYNFKVWAYPLEQMAYKWIGERVAVVDVKKVVESFVLAKDDLSWGPNSTFRFPKEGGTGAIWRAMAREAGLEKIELCTAVERVVPQKKQARLQDGRVVEYEHLLSTAPLDMMAQRIDGLEQHSAARAGMLKHSSSNIVGIGLQGQPREELQSRCWIYFPENNCPFYRVTLFSRYSPHNVPDASQHYSLMAEISESDQKPVSREELLESTIQGMLNTGLISSRNDVVSSWVYRAEHGYPTPSLERDNILAHIIPALEARGVYSRGRFGGWKYEVSNQDHTFMQGVEWADHIVRGQKENTYTCTP